MSTKQSGRVALVGVLSALALVLLLFTYIPSASVAMAAIAAMCGIPVVVELGQKAGLLHYAAVAVLACLIALTAEGTGMYIAFFGWYTVFKAFIEGKQLPRVAEWAIKLAAVTVAVTAYGAVWIFILHMVLPSWFAWWMLAPAVLVGWAVFVLYDVGLTRVIATYHYRLRPKFKEIFRF